MKITFVILCMSISMAVQAQTAKTDTVEGVVIYSARSDLAHITGGEYHTFTVKATEIKADTGIISIRTQFGYIDLKRHYQFIPMDKLQPAKLKSKP